MKTEHTKGKMEYAFGSGVIEDTGILEADRRTNRTTPTERDANVRRAIACWNVCDGYSTEFLENIEKGGFLEVLNRMAADIAELKQAQQPFSVLKVLRAENKQLAAEIESLRKQLHRL